MDEQIRKLKEIHLSMLRQLVDLPVVARMAAAESVRRAEYNIAALGEAIERIEEVCNGK